MTVERHYTGREVAELLALDYETVLKKAHVGEIPSVRLGRLRRFPESGLKTYLAQHTENVVRLRPRVASPEKEARNVDS